MRVSIRARPVASRVAPRPLRDPAFGNSRSEPPAPFNRNGKGRHLPVQLPTWCFVAAREAPQIEPVLLKLQALVVSAQRTGQVSEPPEEDRETGLRPMDERRDNGADNSRNLLTMAALPDGCDGKSCLGSLYRAVRRVNAQRRASEQPRRQPGTAAAAAEPKRRDACGLRDLPLEAVVPWQHERS